jgi:hypothetical protein
MEKNVISLLHSIQLSYSNSTEEIAFALYPAMKILLM